MGDVPVTATITITGLDAALRSLSISNREIVQAVGKAAALSMISHVKPYPSASRKPQPFVSAKQRGYFFAALRSGEIKVPYRRTFDLQDAWSYTLTPGGAEVTNPSSHAAYTINKETQARYHKGTWKTTEELAKVNEGAVRDDAEAALMQVLAELL